MEYLHIVQIKLIKIVIQFCILTLHLYQINSIRRYGKQIFFLIPFFASQDQICFQRGLKVCLQKPGTLWLIYSTLQLLGNYVYQWQNSKSWSLLHIACTGLSWLWIPPTTTKSDTNTHIIIHFIFSKGIHFKWRLFPFKQVCLPSTMTASNVIVSYQNISCSPKQMSFKL